MPTGDVRCRGCYRWTSSVRFWPTLGEPVIDPDYACADCGETEVSTGRIDLVMPDDADTLETVIHVLGQLSPRWCRVGNFYLFDDHGPGRLTPQALGRRLTKMTEAGELEKRYDTTERRVMYRLTEKGLESYYALDPESRPPAPVER